MHRGAKHMLDLAERSEEGQLYFLVASLVFSAFTLEAYLNHLGKLRNSEWDKIERKYSKFEKYKMFSAAAGLKVDFAARTYCSLEALFEFRDRMAHGKSTTEDVAVEIEISAIDSHLPQFNAETDWQAFATIERAREAIKDVEALVKELHASSGYTGNPFTKLGGGIYGVSQPAR